MQFRRVLLLTVLTGSIGPAGTSPFVEAPERGVQVQETKQKATESDPGRVPTLSLDIIQEFSVGDHPAPAAIVVRSQKDPCFFQGGLEAKKQVNISELRECLAGGKDIGLDH